MRSILALSLVGSTVALPFGDVLNTIFGRDPEPIPPPEYFRPTRRLQPTGSGGFPYPTGSGIFPTATGTWPTGSGGISALPFPYPTGSKSLSLDYGLAPTVIDESPEFTLPTEAPGQEEASSGEEIDVEEEDEPSSFTFADPTFGLPVVPTDDPAPRPTKPFPTYVPTGVFPTGIFPTGGFPTGGFPTGVFPTGGYPSGVFPTGFPSTLLTFTRGPAPTGQPPLPEEPTEEEWKAWWEKWLQWAREYSGWGKPEGN